MNAKRGYTERDIRNIIKHQRAVILKYGTSAYIVHESLRILRWAFSQLDLK